MSYNINGQAVIDDRGSIAHKSFEVVTATLTATVVKITAFDGAASDIFGSAIGIGSGRIVVGSPTDDDLGSNSGSAYIYDLNGNFIKKLTAFDGSTEFRFGTSVAAGSGRIVVGSYQGDNSGGIYTYDLDGNFIQKISAFDSSTFDLFGSSVAVGSGRIVSGARFDDDLGTDSGSAYIYDLNGNLIRKITASDGAANDNYGTSVAVGSGRIVVGSPGDSDLGIDSGSAYIYNLNGNFIRKIIAPDGVAGDYFGISVAVGWGMIVIGALFNDALGSNSGGVYIYDLDGNFIQKITAPDGFANDYFGIRVAVGSGRIVVGADLDDDRGTNSGSVYIYNLDGSFIQKITAFDGAADDRFGNFVVVGSGRIVVGSPFDDDLGLSSGSVYIYKFSETQDDYYNDIIEGY